MRVFKALVKFVGAGIASFAIMMAFVGCGGGAESVAVDFVKALQNGDAQKVIKYIDTSGLDKNETMMLTGKIGAVIDDNKAKSEKKGGVKSIEIENADVKEESANIKVKITFKNDTAKIENVQLVKVGGDWKVKI